MKRGFRVLFLVLTLGALFGMQALYADPIIGSLQIRLTESVGGTSVTITDQGACAGACGGWSNDINATLGVVTGSGSLGGWTVNVTTGMGFPFIGGGNQQSQLDLNSVNATSAPGGGTLTIQVTQVGFNQAQPGYSLAAGGTLAGSGPGASVLYTASGTNNNTPFSTSNTIASLGPFTGASFSGSVSGNPFSPAAKPYSLTLSTIVQASPNGPTTYSGDVHLQPVPEPTSIACLGTGLVGLAFLRRKSKAGK